MMTIDEMRDYFEAERLHAFIDYFDENFSSKIKGSFIRQNNIPVEVLEALTKSKDENVRVAVVASSNCTPAILSLLSKDTSAKVRSAVACNKDTPLHVLEELSDDENSDIRWSISSNQSTSKEILEKMARRELACTNPSFNVLHRIILNNNVFNIMQHL